MPTFNAKFQPATNKEGLSLLTFKGLDILKGKKGEVSKKGTTYAKDFTIPRLVFEVQGKIKGTTQEIKPVLSTEYEDGNDLAILLANMGYEKPNLDDLESDDEFGVIEEEDANLMIDEFLESVIEGRYVGLVTTNKEGYLELNVESVKPYVKKPAK